MSPRSGWSGLGFPGNKVWGPGSNADDILIAFLGISGAGGSADPPDLSANAWTKAWWSGDFSDPAQFPGPGGQAAVGMWWRHVVPGEPASVLDMGGTNPATNAVWVFQLRGLGGAPVVSHANDSIAYAAAAPVNVSSPAAAPSSVFFGMFGLQKVSYGQATGIPTALGTELVNVNGINVPAVCGNADGNQPRVWAGYLAGAGVLTVGGVFTCSGAGPDYNLYGRGKGGLTFGQTGPLSVVQSAFAGSGGADVIVTLPSAP